MGNVKSYLICFDGKPVVNGKKMEKWDYASLVNKIYEVELNDGILALFTKRY